MHARELDESIWTRLCMNVLSSNSLMLFPLSSICIKAAAIDALVSWGPARKDCWNDLTVESRKVHRLTYQFTLVEAGNKLLEVSSFSHLDYKVSVVGEVLQHLTGFL